MLVFILILVFILLLPLLLLAINETALLSADARPTEPVFIVFRLDLDANTCPRVGNWSFFYLITSLVLVEMFGELTLSWPAMSLVSDSRDISLKILRHLTSTRHQKLTSDTTHHTRRIQSSAFRRRLCRTLDISKQSHHRRPADQIPVSVKEGRRERKNKLQ